MRAGGDRPRKRAPPAVLTRSHGDQERLPARSARPRRVARLRARRRTCRSQLGRELCQRLDLVLGRPVEQTAGRPVRDRARDGEIRTSDPGIGMCCDGSDSFAVVRALSDPLVRVNNRMSTTRRFRRVWRIRISPLCRLSSDGRVPEIARTRSSPIRPSRTASWRRCCRWARSRSSRCGGPSKEANSRRRLAPN